MKRYYIIDFSRGIAALAVLLSHYGHFFQYKQSGYPENWVNTNLPLYDYLGFFYHQGGKRCRTLFFVFQALFFLCFILKGSQTGLFHHTNFLS